MKMRQRKRRLYSRHEKIDSVLLKLRPYQRAAYHFMKKAGIPIKVDHVVGKRAIMTIYGTSL